MEQTETEKCLNNPKFRRLVRAKGRFSLLFTAFITFEYILYASAVAFAPAFMARSVEGGAMTYGILSAIGVIISGMICSGIYIWWANRHFDVLKEDLLRDMGHE